MKSEKLIYLLLSRKDWEESFYPPVLATTDFHELCENILEQYNLYRNEISLMVDVWFEGEKKYFCFLPENTGLPLEESEKIYKEQLLRRKDEFLNPPKIEQAKSPSCIAKNGRMISCEKIMIYGDFEDGYHYKVSFELDVFNEDTNEKVGKYIVEFPDVVYPEGNLEDFLYKDFELVEMGAGSIKFNILDKNVKEGV